MSQKYCDCFFVTFNLNTVIFHQMEPLLKNEIIIFTDGACSGNPGPGGWGSIIVDPFVSEDLQIKELGGFEANTTNNKMELKAVIEALKKTKNKQNPIFIYTDSVYVIRGITQWIWGWMKKNWKNSENQDVANKELWLDLHHTINQSYSKKNMHWRYSRGHVGTPGNERCDEIAVAFSQKKKINLYQGSLLKYEVPVLDLPDFEELPEMKNYKDKKEKTSFHSYLSYVHGKVYRHSTWASCEKKIKGHSGAKCKKALLESDEIEILKAWNLDILKIEIHDEG